MKGLFSVPDHTQSFPLYSSCTDYLMIFGWRPTIFPAVLITLAYLVLFGQLIVVLLVPVKCLYQTDRDAEHEDALCKAGVDSLHNILTDTKALHFP